MAHELPPYHDRDTIVNRFARRSAIILSISALAFETIAALDASLLGTGTEPMECSYSFCSSSSFQ